METCGLFSYFWFSEVLSKMTLCTDSRGGSGCDYFTDGQTAASHGGYKDCFSPCCVSKGSQHTCTPWRAITKRQMHNQLSESDTKNIAPSLHACSHPSQKKIVCMFCFIASQTCGSSALLHADRAVSSTAVQQSVAMPHIPLRLICMLCVQPLVSVT